MKILLILCIFTLASCGKQPLFLPNKSVVKAEALGKDIGTKIDQKFSFAIEWINPPKLYENSPFKLRFWKNTDSFWGPYVEMENICVFLWMKMPDGSEHGSSPVNIKKIQKIDEVIYLVDDVYFVMNGKWQIRVRRLNHGQSCSGKIDKSFISEKIFEIYIN